MTLTMACICSGIGTAAGLRIITEENPPLNFTEDNRVTGFATEVVEEIQRRIGEHDPIQVLPWARGYEMALREPGTMLFSTTRTLERERQFKWVGPLTVAKTAFYGRKGGNIKVASLEDARRLPRIGVPNAFYSEQFLRRAGFTNLDIAYSPSIMIRKFLANRYDIIVSDDFTLPAILAENSITPDLVIPLFVFMENERFLAFSLGTDDREVARWQSSINVMKKDGTFAKLFTRWLPGKKMPR